jgi:hypothetical protein
MARASLMLTVPWLLMGTLPGPRWAGQQGEAPAPDPRLDALANIVQPESVSFTPVTVGWKILLLIVAVALAAAAWAAFRHWRQNRYRREALAELETLSAAATGSGPGKVEALRALPVLLRRVVLSVNERTDVASLSGGPWLDYLDARYPGRGFAQGPGRHVEAMGYLPDPQVDGLDPQTVKALLGEVRGWIERHEAGHA